MHLADLIPVYLRYAQTRVDPPPISRLSARAYRSRLRQFCDWAGERPIDSELLKEFREWLQFEAENQKGSRGQKPRSLKSAFTPLALFFDWLRKEHGMEHLPDPRKTPRPRINKNDHGDSYTPQDDEVNALFAAAASLPGYTLVERYYRAQTKVALSLAADAALRRCEILALDRDDIQREGSRWVVNVRGGKGEEARTVALNARFLEHWRHYQEVWAEWCRQEPARRRNLALLPVDRSRRWSRDTIHQMRWRLLHAAGLSGKRVRLHDFRAYRITSWLGVNGVNPASVAELAGHTDVATTLTYSRAVEAEKSRAVAESAGGTGTLERQREVVKRPQRRAPGSVRGRR